MALAGKDGDCTIAGYTVDLKEWSLDLGADAMDSSKFGDSWKTNVGGLLEWSGSASGFAPNSDMVVTGSSIAITFDDGAGSWAGNGIVTKVGIKAAVDGLVEISFDITGNGAIAYTP